MIRNLFALLTAAVLLTLGFMFSLVILVVVAVIGLVLWAYVWWKTRELRRQMREQTPDGRIYDGESVVVEEGFVRTEKILPKDSTEP